MARSHVLLGAVLAACMGMAAATRASYDQNFALDMVYMSAAAYCPAEEIKSWTCNSCSLPDFNVTAVAQNTYWDVQAYVGFSASTDTIIIAYRGTEASNIKNWILDLQADHTNVTYPHCDCKVEAGFYKAHELLRPQVVAAMHSLKNEHPSASLYITGHSLGAAMAVLCAAHIQTQEGVSVDEVYTFGLPRVGDTAFSQWFNEQLPQAIHVTHDDDIVPHLPPQFFGYHHTPTEVWYTEQTGLDYKVCNGSGEDPTCADSVSVFDYSVADHLVYLDVHICGCYNLPPPPRR